MKNLENKGVIIGIAEAVVKFNEISGNQLKLKLIDNWKQRKVYMQALEQTSMKHNIEPFDKFLGHLVTESMQGTPAAKALT